MGSHQQQQAETFLYPYAKSSSISPPHHQDHHPHQQNSVGSTSTRGEFLESFDSFLSPELVRKVVAELIATYLLVFVTCGTAAISSVNERQLSRLGASVAGGLIVTVMIYAVGHISGAHMNPAVTLAFTAIRRFPLKQVPFYAAAQLTGAISAGFTLRMLLDPSIYKLLGTTSPSGSDTQALIMEVVVTFCMMFVTSAVATDAKAIGELAVGSSVCITSILAGPISGGSMNPARTIGPALASGYYKGLWIYMVGPVMGTLLGVWAYTLITSGSPAITVTATGPPHHVSESSDTKNKQQQLP